MLEQIMQEIRAGGTLEINALAVRFNTSPQMIAAMLEHLQRSGMIRPYQQSCGDGCGGCSLKSSCKISSSKSTVRLWQA